MRNTWVEKLRQRDMKGRNTLRNLGSQMKQNQKTLNNWHRMQTVTLFSLFTQLFFHQSLCEAGDTLFMNFMKFIKKCVPVTITSLIKTTKTEEQQTK